MQIPTFEVFNVSQPIRKEVKSVGQSKKMSRGGPNIIRPVGFPCASLTVNYVYKLCLVLV